MKTLALFSLSLAVTLGMPFAPGVEQTPVLTEREQSPLLGDWVPVQGHVVVEDPAPQVRPRFEEQKKELAPVPVDMKQSIVEPEIKVKPQVREEQDEEAKTEIKKEPDVKAEPDVKEDLEADVEPELNLNSEVMAEVTADVEPELNGDPEFKVKSEVKVEPDVQEQFQVQTNLEAEIETGREIEERHIDMEGKYEMVGEPIMELEPLDDDNTELSDVEKSLRAAFQNQDPVNQPLPEEEEGLMRERDNDLDGEPIMELEPLDDDNTELSEVEKSLRATFQNQNPVNQPLPQEEEGLMRERDNDLDGEPIMELEPLDYDNTELSEVEKSLRAAFQNQNPVNQPLPEFKVKSEVKVEPDVQEQFQGREIEERHIDMEGKYEMVGEPIMELEPLDDDNTELSEVEKSLRAAFQNQDPVNQPLPEEEELLMSERDNVSDGEPIMELEPEDEESFFHQQVMPEAAIMEEGPALDIMGQQISSSREYFPNEEARMGMDYGTRQNYLTDYVMMEEPEGEFLRVEKQSSMGLPEMEDGPDGGVQIGVAPKREKWALMRQGVQNHEETRSSPNQSKQGRHHCPGVILEGMCYQFFKGPKTAADAEFFCQDVTGGHLASITGQHIHREVMNMMLRQNGALTRSWIGGLRYLKTGRFIWLDGSHWSYADWLSGEPNNTSDVEECVEVLPHGNGKFNDFTCWEPQAFICSYPY